MKIVSALNMLLTMSCDQASRLLSDGQDQPLCLTERTALRLHLYICRACRRYRRQLRILRDLIDRWRKKCSRDDFGSDELSDEQRNRIRKALREHS
jgi:hypothetical protein